MRIVVYLLIVAGCVGVTACRSTTGKSSTQLEMNEQAAAESRQADVQMEKVCAEIRAQLDAGGCAKFDAAQTAWLAFRKAEAESCADFYRGGSIMPWVYCQSLTDSTKRRISQLQAELSELKAH
jgi:uncharacterized protein YecT (DUF1311 family)